MKDRRKTKAQLIEELETLRQQIAVPHADAQVTTALSESEERYQKIFQHSHDAIFVCDLERDAIVDVNPRTCSLLGFSREELLSTPMSAIHPDEMPRLQAFVQSVFVAGHGWTNTLSCRAKTGELIPAEITASVLETDGKRYLLAMVRDITARKQADAALRESEERYRDLFDNATDAMYERDLVGNLIACNAAAERLTGYTRTELLQMHMAQLVPPEQRQLLQTLTLAVHGLAGENEPPFEMEMLRKDGRRVRVEINPRMIFRDGKPVAVHGIVRDITERKRAEEALRESEERYRLISEAISDYVYSASILPDGRVIMRWITDAFQRITGYTLDEIKARGGLPALIFPDDLPRVIQFSHAVLANQAGTIECRIVTKDGAVRWLHDHVRPVWDTEQQRVVQILGAVQDITARKQADAALRESEERYRDLFENANDGIAAVSLDRTIVAVNRAMEHLLGWSREELVGQDYYMVLTPDGIALSEERERRLQAGKKISSIFEHEFRRKDGSTVPVEGRIRFVRDLAGKPTGFQGIYRDITARKAAEEKNRQLQQHLFQAQKLQAIGTLAGGVAHDFNNILMIMMAYIELALDDLPKGTIGWGNLQEALQAGHRAKALVQQLGTFGRADGQQQQATLLHQVVTDTLALLRPTVPEQVAVCYEARTTTGYVRANPVRMQQLVMNLCVNALQAMPGGSGTLEVSLEQVEIAPDMELELSHLPPGPYLRLVVCDTGYGMTSEVMKRMFEPFFTTKPIGGGSGLGLSVVHGIVTDLGGAVTASSQPGKGATFQIYLPLLVEQASLVAEGV